MGSSSELFTSEEVRRIVVGWIAIWTLAHYICWPLWNRRRFLVLACRPTPLDRYRRRLCRAQVYNFLAVCGGAHLVSRYRWDPADFISSFTTEHQVLFSMAIGHWSVMIWEEMRTANFLSQGMKNGDVAEVDDPNGVLVSAYFWHHVAAIACFGAVLALQSCSGLGTAGLVFELPVLLMNHREFIIYADKMPKWFLDHDNVDSFWECLDTLFLAARGGAAAVYVYSLCCWKDYLTTLSNLELCVYHTMAIGFTVLNYFLAVTFLGFWGLSDRQKARQSEEAAFEDVSGESVISCDGRGAAALEGEEEVSEPAHQNVDASKELGWLPQGFLNQRKDAAETGEDGRVFIEIDTIAYNVTSFLDKHPGGAAVLRKYSCEDASESFHRVRHSMNAKRMMQQFAVGPIRKPIRSYRIFEHAEAQGRTYREGFQIFASYFLVGVALPRSNFFSVSALPSAGVSFGAVVVPGLLVTLMAGLSFLFMMFWSTAPTQNGFSLGSMIVGMCLPLHVVALAVARLPPPADAPACPTGLEIGAWTIFLLREVVQRMQGSRGWIARFLLSFGLIILSWVLRGLLEAGSAASGQVAAGIVFGMTTVVLCKRASDDRPKTVTAPEFLVGAALAGPYSAACLFYLAATDPAVAKAIGTWWPTSLLSFFASEGVALLVFISIGVLVNSANICTDAWSSRCLAMALSVASCVAGGWSSWRWLAWLAFVVILSGLADRLTELHNQCVANDTFKFLHPYQHGTRASWDISRVLLCEILWYSVVKPMRVVASFILPEELCVVALSQPVFNFGENANMGIAVYFAPCAAASTTKGPEHCELTVSHVDLHHPDDKGSEDLYKKMNTVRDAWVEFKRPAKGFLANIVCLFPRMGDAGVAKHVQLSCWQTSEDAQAWRAKSGAYQDTVRQLEGSSLRTCGSLKTTLEPHGPIRHQDRCTHCARLIESETIGEHAPKICRVCGGKAFGYPLL